MVIYTHAWGNGHEKVSFGFVWLNSGKPCTNVILSSSTRSLFVSNLLVYKLCDAVCEKFQWSPTSCVERERVKLIFRKLLNFIYDPTWKLQHCWKLTKHLFRRQTRRTLWSLSNLHWYRIEADKGSSLNFIITFINNVSQIKFLSIAVSFV